MGSLLSFDVFYYTRLIEKIIGIHHVFFEWNRDKRKGAMV